MNGKRIFLANSPATSISLLGTDFSSHAAYSVSCRLPFDSHGMRMHDHLTNASQRKQKNRRIAAWTRNSLCGRESFLNEMSIIEKAQNDAMNIASRRSGPNGRPNRLSEIVAIRR